MVQVQEVSKKGLHREFTVTVPQAAVEKDVLARLEEIGKTAKVQGFRPGKIPMHVLKQRFGSGARAEVLDLTVSETAGKALSDRKLRPAGQPKIELVSFGEEKDLEFKLAVEILPEIVAADFGKLALERLVADVTDATVDDAIARVVRKMREPELVEDQRAAEVGDVLVIDFNGTVDGKPQPGMKGEGHRLELGSKSFIDTFENQLVGSRAGDKKTIKVTFPAEYHAANLAGQKAEFAVEVKELRRYKPVELNDELAKELGLPSLEKLRERVKDDITANYSAISRTVLKRQLMDKLAESHSFEVPAGMLEREFNSIWQQVEAGKARGEIAKEDKKKTDDELRKEYRGIAERRVRLGLLLSDIAEKQKIGLAPKELQNALLAEARRFPGQEKAVIDYYTKTDGALDRLRMPLIEEKTVDHIIAQAKVTEKKISAEELLKMPEEME